MVNITYFVHGTTTDNEKHIATGWLDGDLSKKGIEQSISLGNIINTNDFDLVITSDLKRAIDSANYIFKNKIKMLKDKRIRECNYGELNGKENYLVKYEEHIYNRFPNGENLIDVETRVKDFCDFLYKNYSNMNIAIVSHKAPQLAMQVLTEGKSWNQVINEDWRKRKDWQPGWKYIIKDK